MSGDDEDHFKTDNVSKAPKDLVWAHLGRCWRGECTLLITFLTGTGVVAAVVFPLFWLAGSAITEQWSPEMHFAILMLKFVGLVLAWLWLGVGLLRSSLRNYLLGRRFWPIVAGIYGGMGVIFAAWSVVTAGPTMIATTIRLLGIID
jgi:hypothetical protein